MSVANKNSNASSKAKTFTQVKDFTELNIFLNGQTPLEKLAEWYAEAVQVSKKYPELFKHPDAFVLSTVGGPKNKPEPSSRVLLVKEIRPTGLVFYSNYTSRKGLEMKKNPSVALNFFWSPLYKQVCLRGHVKLLSKADSIKYWESRARESQLSQTVSQQSQPVESREQLETEWHLAEKKFADKKIPLPKNWGGYFFTATYVEFWVGRDGRFHDRYSYNLHGKKWRGARLYP